MASYHVTWEIDVDGDNPVEAARKAWEAMRAQDSTANVFQICAEGGEPVGVDLMAVEDGLQCRICATPCPEGDGYAGHCRGGGN